MHIFICSQIIDENKITGRNYDISIIYTLFFLKFDNFFTSYCFLVNFPTLHGVHKIWVCYILLKEKLVTFLFTRKKGGTRL
ncbi:hypothetical protein D7Z94_04325 [Ulvibacterium marinum]|uniref:Uncharacterized protein n=1 Tax=Ulvibacterium marinum TaxID=2419782 RepID=A0A3B0CB70_9FLAO|nr:hypothetical protein D7Z94_04325 [Ulvibacterium marinum]